MLHGVERTGFSLADRVLIVGAGPIGILLAKTIAIQGASNITQVDRNAERLSMAGENGAHRTCASLEELGDERFDVVVDATGVPAVMAQAIDYARYGGTVLLFGVPPQDGVLSVNAFPIFRKGLRILSSFTSVRDSIQAVRLLSSGRIDVGPLISHRLPLSKLEHGIDLMETGRDGVMKVHILPQG